MSWEDKYDLGLLWGPFISEKTWLRSFRLDREWLTTLSTSVIWVSLLSQKGVGGFCVNRLDKKLAMCSKMLHERKGEGILGSWDKKGLDLTLLSLPWPDMPTPTSLCLCLSVCLSVSLSVFVCLSVFLSLSYLLLLLLRTPAISLGFTIFGWDLCICDRFLIQPLR